MNYEPDITPFLSKNPLAVVADWFYRTFIDPLIAVKEQMDQSWTKQFCEAEVARLSRNALSGRFQ